MKYRIEKKLLIKQNNFFNFCKKYNIKKQFSDRYILSHYFDNKNLDMFYQSEEGILPRKKIRLRTYPKFFLDFESKNNYFYEEKSSDFFGRNKISKKINDIKLMINSGLWSNGYGRCSLTSSVFYRRQYFIYKQIRFTSDDMIYVRSKYKTKRISENIIEAKFDVSMLNFFENIFQIKEKRFSKYCESIKTLY